MNLNRMVNQVKCIKTKIVKKFREKKYLKEPSPSDYDYYPNQSQTDFERQKSDHYYLNEPNVVFESSKIVEKFKSKFNFSRIEQKLNISGKLNSLKKKFLRLVQLEDCFEEEEVKYGFRSKVTLVENSPCILGSTCRGVPEGESRTQSNFIRKELDLNSIWDEVDLDLIRIRSDYLDRQTGEAFSSDGPPDCRVIQSNQCSSNG